MFKNNFFAIAILGVALGVACSKKESKSNLKERMFPGRFSTSAQPILQSENLLFNSPQSIEARLLNEYQSQKCDSDLISEWESPAVKGQGLNEVQNLIVTGVADEASVLRKVEVMAVYYNGEIKEKNEVARFRSQFDLTGSRDVQAIEVSDSELICKKVHPNYLNYNFTVQLPSISMEYNNLDGKNRYENSVFVKFTKDDSCEFIAESFKDEESRVFSTPNTVIDFMKAAKQTVEGDLNGTYEVKVIPVKGYGVEHLYRVEHELQGQKGWNVVIYLDYLYRSISI